MYSESNASMEAIGEFDHADSEGFLRVLQVSARRWPRTGRSSRRRGPRRRMTQARSEQQIVHCGDPCVRFAQPAVFVIVHRDGIVSR